MNAKALVVAHCRQRRFEDAAEAAFLGLRLDPTDSALHQGAFFALSMLGRFSEAGHHSEQALRLAPGSASAHYNFALARLRAGDFEQGWKHFDWHEKLHESTVSPPFPRWLGQSLSGRTLLLIGEQGFGDQIQMLRIADWMKQQGATVDVCVGTPLWEVARDALGVHAAWNVAPPKSYDYWCRTFSAPQHMRLDLDMLPLAMPYLFARAERVEYWRQKVMAMVPIASGTRRKRRIGIVWSGSPGNQTDYYRSIPLSVLEPFLAEFDVVWLGLQKDVAKSESHLLPKKPALYFLGPEIDGFEDTLAILSELDLLISVDTSAVHLAGAAGLPAWVLVPACSDWRWMVNRSDTPWYPSVRIFRQKELSRWDGVFQDVRTALRALIDEAT
jgi:hypothetical protein